MTRLDFIKKGTFSCIAATSAFGMIQGCVSGKTINAVIAGDQIVIPLKEFEIKTGKKKTYRSYLIVYNSQLRYPFCVFRYSAHEYSALQMRCTHQGTELSVNGDKLTCSAHGSEFDNKGRVYKGPAENPLKSFPVFPDNEKLIISLKSI
ncbi:MAG: Rieske (2Fe-2S) protein [Bacteroidota bacterium]|nr:Rieske (2Fe-2S) protein [Bacteroidota bacterium]